MVARSNVPTGLAACLGAPFPTLKRGANKRCAYGAGTGERKRRNRGIEHASPVLECEGPVRLRSGRAPSDQ